MLRDPREFRVRKRDLLAAGAFQHQWRYEDQREQCQPRADSDKLLEFHSLAVETDAEHLSPRPLGKVRERIKEAFLELRKIGKIPQTMNRQMKWRLKTQLR